ncbi:unnamed protein product [Euphydryas editha]|uniref:Reverse transcriptase domain-containing protein n=1 Tax=Euphydryas editha TaxID=104508 RepID=A0AAU9TIW3_EUPED|nr:unnamed protein product [Euphydryas editha]
MNRPVYICFIDYEKAFDRIDDKLIEILNNMGLDSTDLTIVRNLYWEQKARVRVDQVLTNDTDIQRDVRQGCILSPLVFNLQAGARLFVTAAVARSRKDLWDI